MRKYHVRFLGGKRRHPLGAPDLPDFKYNVLSPALPRSRSKLYNLMQYCNQLSEASVHFTHAPGQVTVYDITVLRKRLPEYSTKFMLHHLVERLSASVLQKPLDELTLQEALVYMKLTGIEDLRTLSQKMKEERYYRRGGWTGGRMTVTDLFLRAEEQKTSIEEVFEDLHTHVFLNEEEQK